MKTSMVRWCLGPALLSCAASGCALHRHPGDGQWTLFARKPSIEQFIKIRWPRNGELTATGDFYHVDRQDGVSQLFRRRAGQEKATVLTEFEDGIGGYVRSFDDRWIVLTAGRGGDEQYDLYLLDTTTDEIEPLQVDRDTVFGSIRWRRDSKAFAYRANKDSKSDFNVYVYDLDSRSARKVWNEPGYFYPTDFNSDGTTLVIEKYLSASESHLYELSLADNAWREITPTHGKWSFRSVGYSPDDEKYFVVSNFGGDVHTLQAIDLRNAAMQRVLEDSNDREMDYAVLNEQRNRIATVVNEDGYGTLQLYSVPRFEKLPGPPIKKGVVGNVRFTDDTMLFSLNNANTPGIIYKWQVEQPNSAPVKLTKADTQRIDTNRFVQPRLVKFRSFDGLEVPAFLYLPEGYEGDEPIPFVLYYHGGPEEQFRPTFSRVFQYLLSRGFGVMAPNVRGSRGYGMKYLEMDNYRKRMDSVKDGVAAAKWLVDNGFSAPKMMAAYGGSYGGFMVIAVITQAPELFGAACDVVGIVNFETFLKRTKSYRRALREAEYGPLSDPEFLKSISPIHLADRIDTPVLIAHGENDPRVPVSEARQLYAALKERGQNPELLIFDDEGHGFAKEANRIVFYQRLADFFEKHLK